MVGYKYDISVYLLNIYNITSAILVNKNVTILCACVRIVSRVMIKKKSSSNKTRELQFIIGIRRQQASNF